MKPRERYVHSGRFTLSGLLRGLVVGSFFGAGLAVAYAYAILYVPLAGYITALLTGGFGLFLGVSIGLPLKTGKTRNRRAAVLCALPVVLGAFYVSWAVWVFAFLRRSGGEGVPLQALLLHPRDLWDTIVQINAVGPWRLKGLRPTGAWLWALWGIEALTVIGLGLLGAQTTLDQPFCERCELWTEEEKELLALAPVDREELVRRLETDDLDTAFRKLGPPAEDNPKCLLVSLQSCPSCRELNALVVTSLERVTIRKRDQVNRRSLLRDLLISRREADACRSLSAQPTWSSIRDWRKS